MCRFDCRLASRCGRVYPDFRNAVQEGRDIADADVAPNLDSAMAGVDIAFRHVR
jgi:hypothetical protein